MAAVIPISQLTKYPCETQEEEDPSYGPAPVSNLAGTTGDNAPDKPDSLVVGFGTIVPRWDVTLPGGRTLQYFVRGSTFPSVDQARSAARSFQEAADSWNKTRLGITISETTEQESANFCLVYQVNSDENPNTFAQAFFPHQADQDVIVYSKAFEHNYFPILKNIFQHEIGHVLGLRHEFAITRDVAKQLNPEAVKAVQYLENNDYSIMSYNMPPKIQESDRKQIASFYQLANGLMMNGITITDYQPQVRRSNGH